MNLFIQVLGYLSANLGKVHHYKRLFTIFILFCSNNNKKTLKINDCKLLKYNKLKFFLVKDKISKRRFVCLI